MAVSSDGAHRRVAERAGERAAELHGERSGERVHVLRVVEPDEGGVRPRALDTHERPWIGLELADEGLVAQVLHGHLRGDEATRRGVTEGAHGGGSSGV